MEIFNLILIPIFFIWELPQNIIGFFVFLIFKMQKRISKGEFFKYRLFFQNNKYGVSLGFFIFYYNASGIKSHEYGHTIQSRILGPLYLILVGLPSVIRANYYNHHPELTTQQYMGKYPENWATNLGKNYF